MPTDSPTQGSSQLSSFAQSPSGRYVPPTLAMTASSPPAPFQTLTATQTASTTQAVSQVASQLGVQSQFNSRSIGSSASQSISPCTLVEVRRKGAGRNVAACTPTLYAQVPIAVVLYGGVPPSTVVLPSIAVLLRLSLACYLQVPLAAMLITDVTTTDSSAQQLVLGPEDPANTQTGFCALVSGGSSSSLDAQLSGRRLQASGSPTMLNTATTTVSLVVVTCTGPDMGSPQELQALLGSLSGRGSATITPGLIGSSPIPTPPPSYLFASFTAAVSNSAGVSGRVTISTPLVGSAQAHASPSTVRKTPDLPAAVAAAPVSIVVVAGAAAGVLVLLVVVVVIWLATRQRQRGVGGPLNGAMGEDFSFANRQGSPGGPSERGLAAAAAFKAGRIAAQRAEQEAQSNGGLGGKPTNVSEGSGAVRIMQPRRAVVVKTVFAQTATEPDRIPTMINPLTAGDRKDSDCATPFSDRVPDPVGKGPARVIPLAALRGNAARRRAFTVDTQNATDGDSCVLERNPMWS